ncbi:MAG: hypothetical protein E7592_01425 [Ruminococcaceae bacterium]|nr:hypothetical protein [Oscillospiraceae bacterium]
MKRFFNWAKNKIVNFVKWLWQECKDWRTFILLVIVCIVVGAPVWISGLLGILFNWTWAWAVFAALLAFWWLPGVPYFALCVAVTLAIKRFFEKKTAKKAKAKGIAEISKDLEEIVENTDAEEDN